MQKGDHRPKGEREAYTVLYAGFIAAPIIAGDEDAMQEILIKVLTKLSTFRGQSQFRTCLYRLAVNHPLNMNRGSMEARQWTFRYIGG